MPFPPNLPGPGPLLVFREVPENPPEPIETFATQFLFDQFEGWPVEAWAPFDYEALDPATSVDATWIAAANPPAAVLPTAEELQAEHLVFDQLEAWPVESWAPFDYDVQESMRGSAGVEAQLAPNASVDEPFETQGAGTQLTISNTAFNSSSGSLRSADNDLFVDTLAYRVLDPTGASTAALGGLDTLVANALQNRVFQSFLFATSAYPTASLGIAQHDLASAGMTIRLRPDGTLGIYNFSGTLVVATSTVVPVASFVRLEILFERQGATSGSNEGTVALDLFLNPTATVADEHIAASQVFSAGDARGDQLGAIGIRVNGFGTPGHAVWFDEYQASTAAMPTPKLTAPATGARPSLIAAHQTHDQLEAWPVEAWAPFDYEVLDPATTVDATWIAIANPPAPSGPTDEEAQAAAQTFDNLEAWTATDWGLPEESDRGGGSKSFGWQHYHHPNDNSSWHAHRLVLQLDASTLGLAEDADVTTWPDSSGEGHTFAGPGTASKPKYRATRAWTPFADIGVVWMPGLNDVWFDGGDLRGLLASGEATMFVVWRSGAEAGGSDSDYTLFSNVDNDGWWSKDDLRGSYFGTFRTTRLDGYPDPLNTTPPDYSELFREGKRLLSLVADASTYQVWMNGESPWGQGNSGYTFSQGNRNWLWGGAGGQGQQRTLLGHLAELRVYNWALSTAERQAVEAELTTKWFSDDITATIYPTGSEDVAGTFDWQPFDYEALDPTTSVDSTTAVANPPAPSGPTDAEAQAAAQTFVNLEAWTSGDWNPFDYEALDPATSVDNSFVNSANFFAINATVVVPLATATADANVPTTKVTLLPAISTATADANVPTIKVTVVAPQAASTADANVPALKVTLLASQAASTADANTPVLKATLVAPQAAATADANAPVLKVTIAATQAAATADALTPTVQTGSSVAAPQATATATANTPTVNVTLVAPQAAATATANTPTVLVTVVGPIATATASALVPTVTTTVNVSAPLTTATADANVPVLKVTLPAPQATATADANVPVLRVTVLAPQAAATADATVPAIHTNVTIAAPQATATADANTPSVKVTLLPATTTATADALAPTLLGTVIELIATADADALVPVPKITVVAPQATATADANTPVTRITVLAPQAAATADANVPAVHASSTVAAPQATATADANTPTIKVTLVAPLADSTGTAFAPTVRVTVVAPQAAATADALTPAIHASSTVMAPMAEASGLVPGDFSSEFSEEFDHPPRVLITVAAPQATGTAAALAPTIEVTVVAPQASATADGIIPAVHTNVTIAATQATAAADAPAPIGKVAVLAPQATATGDANTPILRITVVAPQATATAAGLAPTVHTDTLIQVPMATATAIALAPTPLMYRLVAPDSDVVTGTWHDTPLYAKVDEDPYDDTDYITSGVNPVNDTAELTLGSVGTPLSSGWLLRYRAKVTDVATPQELEVQLRQGATVIAGWTETTLTTSFQTFEHVLSDVEIASITDADDLRVELIASVV